MSLPFAVGWVLLVSCNVDSQFGLTQIQTAVTQRALEDAAFDALSSFGAVSSFMLYQVFGVVSRFGAVSNFHGVCCEHARFCVEVFYALYKKFIHSFIQ